MRICSSAEEEEEEEEEMREEVERNLGESRKQKKE